MLLFLHADGFQLDQKGLQGIHHMGADIAAPQKQQQAAQKIVALGLSVRQAELLCKNMVREPAPQKPVSLAVDYVAECEKNLSRHLGRGVKIVNGKRKGRFELEFYGQEDLQKLLDALMQIER